MKNPMRSPKRGMILLLETMPLLTLTLMLLATGCGTTKVDQISPDREVLTVKKGVMFTPPENGKFVPDERWNEMRDVYIRKSFDK